MAVCNGGLVDTRELRTRMGNSFLSPQYLATGKTAQDLVFTQCGMSILSIGLPYTLHWGKINFNLTEPRIRQMYRDASVNKWLTARRRGSKKKSYDKFIVR